MSSSKGAPQDSPESDPAPTEEVQPPESSDSRKAPQSLSELLDHFVESTEGQDQVRIGDLLDSLSSRSHGPMLLFPAIIAISPIGMIPGMSVVTGTLIILIATQMMFFSSRPWIPKRLADFEFSRDKLVRGVDKTRPWVKRLETWIRLRLPQLASGVFIYPIALVAIVLAASFYPLALVPFGVLAPGMAITLFALGLTARDGLLVLLGFVLTTASVGLAVWWWA